jgi:hypothetical protein
MVGRGANARMTPIPVFRLAQYEVTQHLDLVIETRQNSSIYLLDDINLWPDGNFVFCVANAAFQISS